MSYCNGEKPKNNVSEIQIFYFLTITINVHSKFTTLVSLQSSQWFQSPMIQSSSLSYHQRYSLSHYHHHQPHPYAFPT